MAKKIGAADPAVRDVRICSDYTELVNATAIWMEGWMNGEARRSNGYPAMPPFEGLQAVHARVDEMVKGGFNIKVWDIAGVEGGEATAFAKSELDAAE